MMRRSFISLLRKDFKLMIASKFLLLTLGSLILYSCYINLVYVKIDQDIYPVYLWDPYQTQNNVSSDIIEVPELDTLHRKIQDGYSVGVDATGNTPEFIMVSSGIPSTDAYRSAYALSLLSSTDRFQADIIGSNNKEMKSRREITCEFLFFELAAVGFLGLASMLFKEKQMGIIRVHGVLPVSKTAFVFSKLFLFLLWDLIFAALLTVINLGVAAGLSVLPGVLLQAGILSFIMALIGFFCAVWIHDFKQFSLLYLVLAVFISTPVFLAGQAGMDWAWIRYHPMYHLFMAMKKAYFNTASSNGIYYAACGLTIVLLFLLVRHMLIREMAKEG